MSPKSHLFIEKSEEFSKVPLPENIQEMASSSTTTGTNKLRYVYNFFVKVLSFLFFSVPVKVKAQQIFQ